MEFTGKAVRFNPPTKTLRSIWNVLMWVKVLKLIVFLRKKLNYSYYL